MVHRHKEPPVIGNIQLICSDCGSEMKRKFQEEMVRDPAYYVGKYVKVMFEDENGAEHMWVKVTDVDGENLVGTLNNIPIVVDMSLDDSVIVGLDEIEAVSE